MAYTFDNKFIAIVGMARSGLAAAEVLQKRARRVTIYDSKSEAELKPAIARAKSLGVTYVTSADEVMHADLAIVSPGVRKDAPILASARQQGIPVLGEVEAAFRICSAPILAVTGTNGKTTTALLLAEMLRAGGITTFAAGNIAAGSLAMPLIAAADAAGPNDAIVAEISSFQLETIDAFKPKVAAILNITPDHQDRQSWGEYIASKWRIFENQSGADTAVLDSRVPRPPGFVRLPENVVYFDRIERPEWLKGLLLPGEHNRANVMAALCMARAFGIRDSDSAEAALAFKGVVHRLEYVDKIDGVVYINNSMCTNNAAFNSSLDAIAGPKIVIAGGVFKGTDTSPIAASVAANDVRRLVLFGRSAGLIARSVHATTEIDTVVVNDLSQAVEAANSFAKAGDTVILNPGCTSLDQFKDFEERGERFKALVSNYRKEGGS